MVREEIRLLRVDLRKRQEEVLMLNLELEEAYIELDAIGVLSMEAIEGKRHTLSMRFMYTSYQYTL